jgi:hypothetical protein
VRKRNCEREIKEGRKGEKIEDRKKKKEKENE